MNRDAFTSNFIQIGQIIRPQGLDGELKVSFETDDAESVKNLTLVYLRNDRGDYYPARIANVRVDGKRNTFSFFVQFEQIADRNSAESLKNRGIYLEQKDAEDFIPHQKTEENELLDCEVFDENNDSVGLVTDVMDNPAHPILVVATTSGTLMIPLVDHYVISMSNRNIYCKNLDQLEGF